MKVLVDTSRKTFMASKDPEPKMAMGGKQQKTDRNGVPQWTVELFALDESGGEVIRVTVTGDQPKVTQGQPVRVDELEAVHWSNDGRSGVAWRAASIVPNAVSKAA